MILAIDSFREEFQRRDAEVYFPDFKQVLSEEELIRILPDYDGWIAGDDPVSRKVLTAGTSGRLRSVIRWGIGIDNVDFEAARELGLDIVNTPGMFNEEVSDVAMGYLIALARDLSLIDRGVRQGGWPKPAGISLHGKTVALVGFGNIGRSTARKLVAFGMKVIAYDPHFRPCEGVDVETVPWPERIEVADVLILTCALTGSSRHMVNDAVLTKVKRGLLVVNVGRGPLIDEEALSKALKTQAVSAVALDVFEEEPLPQDSPLRNYERNIFGSHNSSNTVEAVRRTSLRAIELAFDRLA
jgi:D-3-phosphoglycerate dehydrogenase